MSKEENENMKKISAAEFINVMMEKHDVDINIKIPEGKIYSLYLKTKYGHGIYPEDGINAVMCGFIDRLIEERMAA